MLQTYDQSTPARGSEPMSIRFSSKDLERPILRLGRWRPSDGGVGLGGPSLDGGFHPRRSEFRHFRHCIWRGLIFRFGVPRPGLGTRQVPHEGGDPPPVRVSSFSSLDLGWSDLWCPKAGTPASRGIGRRPSGGVAPPITAKPVSRAGRRAPRDARRRNRARSAPR